MNGDHCCTIDRAELERWHDAAKRISAPVVAFDSDPVRLRDQVIAQLRADGEYLRAELARTLYPFHSRPQGDQS